MVDPTQLQHDYLYNLGYTDPNIVEYEKNGLSVRFENDNYRLVQDGSTWMNYHVPSMEQVFQLYYHWKLAEGHCICTGMGFLLRENWLLSKKEVTKITVIETNRNIIQYHWEHNPHIMERLNIVNMDAYNYHGSCDTLLIDHWEGFRNNDITCGDYSYLISQKIKHKQLWFWPLDGIISGYYRDYLGINLKDFYDRYKSYFQLTTLPNLTEEELFHICYVYNGGKFNYCNFNKKTYRSAIELSKS